MVKRLGNLINKVADLSNIYLADKKARRAKKSSRRFIEIHDRNVIEENSKLASLLISGNYRTSTYHTFKIYEPKERVIYRLPYYPDRIAHHAIMNILKEYWTSLLIPNTYSCIEGRGIHRCLKDLKRDLYRTRLDDSTKYCLKFDITKFYPSINHKILKDIINRKIKDKRLLQLLYEIIGSTDGVPIGNYLSQYFANLYLSEFDRWCKEELKCRYYYRYADDIVILGSSKEDLRNKLIAIKLYLKELLKLSIKGNYQIFPVESRGIDFVGYVFRHDYIKVRKNIKMRCKLRLLKFPYLERKVYSSYIGWFKHCDAIHLINTILELYYYGLQRKKGKR